MTPNGAGQTQLDSLLGSLSDTPLNNAVLYQLESQPPDARILPALRAAFESHGDKREKQAIAATLIRLGEKSDRYFEFLASFVRQAVQDRTPMFYKRGGRRGEFSPEFENWCALNHKDPNEVRVIQAYVEPMDVQALAQAQDQRADGLFREGLESPNAYVVAFCVEGLARIGDESAIPLISKAAERLGGGQLIAGGLPWYSSVEAERLFERLVPDQATRDYLRRQVVTMRSMESQRAARRAGGGIPK
jgi:HEAT repeat protein